MLSRGIVLEVIVATSDAGKRLDALVRERLPEWSRSRIQDWIKSGRVLVDGRTGKSSYSVRGGERIEVRPADPPPLRAEAEDIPLEILYEDLSLVAIDKPAGMTVHAGAGVHAGTVVNALLGRFGSLSHVGGDLRPGIVHRLDRYTSGVLLVAKTDAAHRALAAAFAARQIEKTYLALVHGTVPADRGRIDKPIARDPVHRTRMTARLASGRSAWTEWRLLDKIGKFSYLEVRIGTGRTHQIRVHLSSIGHPVVGDRLYGAPASPAGIPPLPRYFLHAHEVRLSHPITGAPLVIQSPLPADLREYLDLLRNTVN